MRRISHVVPVIVLRNLCYTLIYSRVTWEITAWGSAFNSTTRRVESVASRLVSLIVAQTITTHLQMSPKYIKFKGVCDYFVP